MLFQSTHPSGVRPTACRRNGPRADFNPRTPVGCDSRRSATGYPSMRFQSTHPSGVRPRVEAGEIHGVFISIHAPQWGATSAVDCPYGHEHFNPRTPVGCDPAQFKTMAEGFEFQSTHPSGVRPAVWEGSAWTPAYFNPRTPVGCDPRYQLTVVPIIDFNPRTPVGCDQGLNNGFDNRVISIHAPQWGATHDGHSTVGGSIFQSTHPSGVRHDALLGLSRSLGISIHAPQWGATSSPPRSTRSPIDFNPRTPVGCDSENGHSIP